MAEAGTIIRVGVFYGKDLGDRVRRYSPKFHQFPSALSRNPKVDKFMLYEESPEPLLVSVSNNPTRVVVRDDYNLIMAVTSDLSSTSLRHAAKLEADLGINLRNGPIDMVAFMSQEHSLAFPEFKQQGEAQAQSMLRFLEKAYGGK